MRTHRLCSPLVFSANPAGFCRGRYENCACAPIASQPASALIHTAAPPLDRHSKPVAMLRGSVALTWNRKLFSKRVDANAPAAPATSTMFLALTPVVDGTAGVILEVEAQSYTVRWGRYTTADKFNAGVLIFSKPPIYRAVNISGTRLSPAY